MISEKANTQKEKNKRNILTNKDNNEKQLSKEEKSDQEVKKIKPAKIIK